MKIVSSILLILFTGILFGQEVELSGKIVDDKSRGIKDVSIRIDGIQGVAAYTNEKGLFTIKLPPNKIYTLRIVYAGKEPLVESIGIENSDKNIGTFRLTQNEFGPVRIDYIRPGEFVDRFPKVVLARLPSPSGNFEDLIKIAGLGVASNNELTANYNVRGGNYDENLIYVNGIEIYRPFLV